MRARGGVAASGRSREGAVRPRCADPEGRERLNPARLSDLWRMHGRIAVAGGEASRGHRPSSPARCNWPSVRTTPRPSGSPTTNWASAIGRSAIRPSSASTSPVAASALHAAGDRRHLAMVHSLSGIMLAQEGRLDEAMSALRQAERLAVHGRSGRRARNGLRQPGERGADAASATSRRSPWPSAASSCRSRPARRTAWASRSRRSVRSACASAT